MESKEESCRTKPTIPPYVGGYTDRRDVVRWDILRVSLHSDLYFANGKVRVLQLRRSGGDSRIGENCSNRDLSLSPSLPPFFCPFSLYHSIVPLILVVINTSVLKEANPLRQS